MHLKKLFKLWPELLMLGCFGWFLYSLITNNNFYNGGPLKRLSVVVKDKPTYYWSADPPDSYYNFTIENNKARFRISEGAVKLVTKKNLVKKLVESIKAGDSITMDIKQKDNTRLDSRSAKIRMIGLYVNGRTILDPSEVQKADQDQISNFWFTISIAIIFYLGLFFWLYFKRRRQKRMSSVPVGIILIIITASIGCGHPENSNNQEIGESTDSTRQIADTNKMSRPDTGIPLHKNKAMNKYFPFEIPENAGYQIVAQLESDELYPKYYELFAKYNYEGNGYCWEGHIRQILEKLDKELLNHIEFDPEAGGFFATADTKENQLKFVETLAPVFSDLGKLEGYIKAADRSRIDD